MTTTTAKGTTVSTPYSSADTYDGPAGVYDRGGELPRSFPTLVVPTKRERFAAALAKVETACELLEVIVPKVIELVSDVREVLELDGSDTTPEGPHRAP